VTERSVSEWLQELAEFLNDAAAAHAFAGAGLQFLLERFEEVSKSVPSDPTNPEPKIILGIGDPNSPEAQPYADLRVADLSARLADAGPVVTQIGQQWVVQVFTAWEEYFRPGLARAYGCQPSDVSYPLLGDLRRLRNDVAHHRGVATKNNSGRCEVVHWVEPGDTILVRGQQVAEFMRLFPWAALQAGPAWNSAS
jgi:hypothetical protein